MRKKRRDKPELNWSEKQFWRAPLVNRQFLPTKFLFNNTTFDHLSVTIAAGENWKSNLTGRYPTQAGIN